MRSKQPQTREHAQDLQLRPTKRWQERGQIPISHPKSDDTPKAEHTSRPRVPPFLLGRWQCVDEQGTVGGLDGVYRKIDDVDREDREPYCQRAVEGGAARGEPARHGRGEPKHEHCYSAEKRAKEHIGAPSAVWGG